MSKLYFRMWHCLLFSITKDALMICSGSSRLLNCKSVVLWLLKLDNLESQTCLTLPFWKNGSDLLMFNEHIHVTKTVSYSPCSGIRCVRCTQLRETDFSPTLNIQSLFSDPWSILTYISLALCPLGYSGNIHLVLTSIFTVKATAPKNQTTVVVNNMIMAS